MITNLDYWGGELYFEDNRVTSCLGRDGKYTAIGIDVFADDREVILTGITTRKSAGKGHVTIPKEDIPQLMEILKRVYDNKGGS